MPKTASEKTSRTRSLPASDEAAQTAQPAHVFEWQSAKIERSEESRGRTPDSADHQIQHRDELQ